MSENFLSVSVIIPTLNGSAHIGALCGALKAQTVCPEIIVVDSSSDDDTAAIARSHGARVTIIKREAFDHGGARNLGSGQAKGEILLFMTQDALPCDDHLIERLIRPLEQERIVAAYARQIPREDATPPERIARFFNYPSVSLVKTGEMIPRLGIKAFFFSNVCSAIRHTVFDEMGGFNEKLIMDEDLSFAARVLFAGFSVAYAAEARVFHSHNYSWFEQFRRYFDTGVFFRDSSALLQSVRVQGEGLRFVLEELKTLTKEREYRWVIYVIGEVVMKYLGFKLGNHYRVLPRPLAGMMSLHRGYWRKR